MTERYRLDPGQSRFTVQGFATGLLSMLAHNPTFAVRDFTGEVGLTPGTTEELSVAVNLKADSLELVDRVSPQDRQEIEGRMRREVLETAVYPEIALQGSGTFAGQTAADRYRFHLHGRLSVHGHMNAFQLEVSLIVRGHRIGLGGEFLLPMSAYGIRPVTALAGAIKMKDQLHVSFDLVGQKVQEVP